MINGNLHPLIVHFPIVLLFLYPLVVLGMMFWKREKRALDILGVIIIVMAVLSMIAATEAGEALEFPVQRISADIYRALEQHAELADAAMSVGYVTLFFHLLYAFLHSAWGKRIATQKDTLQKGMKRGFARMTHWLFGFQKWILRLLLVLSVVLVVLISLVGAAGGKLAFYYRVGALACLEIAHPLDPLVQSVLPMEDKLQKWKEKYAAESNLSAKELYKTLCKST